MACQQRSLWGGSWQDAVHPPSSPLRGAAPICTAKLLLPPQVRSASGGRSARILTRSSSALLFSAASCNPSNVHTKRSSHAHAAPSLPCYLRVVGPLLLPSLQTPPPPASPDYFRASFLFVLPFRRYFPSIASILFPHFLTPKNDLFRLASIDFDPTEPSLRPPADSSKLSLLPSKPRQRHPKLRSCWIL